MRVRRILVVSYLFAALGLMLSKPVAVVHIGPHKAASSYIQSTFSNKAAKLAENGFYWPSYPNGAPMVNKGIADFAASLTPAHIKNTEDSSRKYMTSFFEESLRLKRNIIISSEEFDQVETEGVKVLFSLLIGFDVKLVYVYREFLSHIVSMHFEMNRYEHNIQYSQPFSEFLIARMDNGGGAIVQPHETLARYGDVFGNDSLHIIDLAGSEVLHKDIAYVVYCEIAGVLCDDKSILFGQGNTGFSLVVAQVFAHYRAYTETQNDFKCRFCETPRHEYDFFHQQYEAYLLAPANKLPVVTSKLGMLVPYAQLVDRDLRAAYGKYILYGNQTANFDAMRSGVHMTQLDGTRFALTPLWIRWVRTAYDTARNQSRLCGCE